MDMDFNGTSIMGHVSHKKRVAYRQAYRRLRGHLWITQPDIVQLDCYRYCNLSCDYCNVSPGKAYSLKAGMMSDKVYNTVMKAFSGNDLLWAVAQFMNGEPMLDPKLAWRIAETKRRIGCRSCVITNGSLFSRRNVLINPYLDIRFTISAMDAATYRQIHGRDCYEDVLKTISYFKANKYHPQAYGFNFVKTPENLQQVKEWVKCFSGESRSVFSVHLGEGQAASDACKTDGLVIDYSYRNVASVREYKDTPCNCWRLLGIGMEGEIMLCSDAHPKYNFGNIMKDDWRAAWRERNKQGLDNGVCNECSYRRKDAIEFQRRYYESHA